jgi:hypothetical protein
MVAMATPEPSAIFSWLIPKSALAAIICRAEGISIKALQFITLM